MTDKADQNFDELVNHFDQRIYGTDKGRIRLAVIWRQLCQQVPRIESGRPLRILDAGCGTGAMARKLAGRHELTCCDISRRMIDAVKDTLSGEQTAFDVRYIHAPFQSLDDQEAESFDLVLCHAVLEWLAEPEQAVCELRKLLKPDGYLSLAFYNLHGLIIRNLVRGNLRKVASGRFSGDAGGLTPRHPLSPETVLDWLDEAGYRILDHRGVRTFYDLMQPERRRGIAVEDIIDMELKFSGLEPYRSMARYQHIICVPGQGPAGRQE